MDAEARYEIKNLKWNPRFKDKETERDFMREFNLEALKSGRIGILIIIIAWVGFSWFDLRLSEQVRSSALFFRILIVTPFFIASLIILYSKYAANLYQIVILTSSFIIQLSIFYVVKFYSFYDLTHSMSLDLPLTDSNGKCIFIFVWLLLIFMASITAKLNIIYSLMNGLIYIILNLISIFYYHPSSIIIIIAVPFLITSLPIVWIGSLHVQQYARQNYRASKLLALSMQESESLLLNILPAQIADRLKKTPGTIAEGFNHVSVLFADIEAFTRLSERHHPDVIVEMLNRIFSRFDEISIRYGAEKIKTIGDAYMLAAGIPEVTQNHSAIVADCALDMIKAAEYFRDPDGNPLKIRVGIHTGPAIAGVIGTHKFSYDLWGDTVNTASRMESHGGAGRVHATMEIHDALKDHYVFEPRNEINIKGKGKMKTFWLTHRRGAC